MDKNDLTKEELIQKIDQLELLVKQFLKEKEQETTLDFCWAGNLGHWYWDVKANKVTFNPLKITTLGYTKEEIPDTVGFEFFTSRLHPDDYQKAMDCMENHLLGKTDVYELEYRIQAKDGSYKWYYDRGKISQHNDRGEPALVSGIVFDITQRKEDELYAKDCNKELLKQSITDELTGLKNRRGIVEYLKMLIKCNTNNPLSIGIFDLDDFSKIDDTKGHNVGDEVLIQVGKIMNNSVRRTDMVGRYGGEEFLVTYPNAPLEEAIIVSDRIRKAIEKHDFGDGLHVTISGGVREHKGEHLEEFIDQADKNLYKAKNQGKNKII